MQEMRKRGYFVAKTEHWNSFAHIRQDLFGFADLLCFRPSELGVTAIQATSSANIMSRIHKLEANPYVRPWLHAGNRILVHGWALRGARGKRKVYVLDERIVKEDNLSVPAPSGNGYADTPLV